MPELSKSSGEMRDRSASPDRGEPRAKKPKSSGGFKWKEKRARDHDVIQRDSDPTGRGYRQRSPRRNEYPGRDEDRQAAHRNRDGNHHRNGERSPPQRRYRDVDSSGVKSTDHGGHRDQPRATHERENRHRTPRDESDLGSRDAQRAQPTGGQKDRDNKEKKSKPSKQVAAATGPMIIVNVNDRLGTKAAIPCLASDSIKAFKAIVAAHIGRQPHEIMLKRQGERPFKDQLTLEDYGVSNGVQLDLELDTGD